MIKGDEEAMVRQRRKRPDDVSGSPLIDDDDVKFKTGQKFSCFSCIRRFLCWFFLVTLFITCVLTAVYFLVEGPIDAEAFSLSSPPALTGALAVNDRLTKTEKIMKGEISGPESIYISHDGKFYTGTWDGKIVEISQRKITRSVKIVNKEPCGTYDTEPICGRPLGVRMNRENKLVVADAYLGIYLVDIYSGISKQIVSGDAVIDGRPLGFLNDVEILDDGTILFTDSSSKWDRRRVAYLMLEGKGDGRLLSYNPENKKVSVLLDNLHFPNGIQLPIDQTFVLIAETTRARIIKYHLQGPKTGQSEVFIDNLPGFPDNIRLSSSGNLWIPFAAVRHRDAFSILDFAGPRPWIRNLVAKITPTNLLLKAFNQLKLQHSMIVSVGMNGKYISSLHDPTGKVILDVSQVTDAGPVLFFGSFHSDFIGKLVL